MMIHFELENGSTVSIQMEGGKPYIARVYTKNPDDYKGREIYPNFDVMQSKFGQVTDREEKILHAIFD